MVGRAPKPDAGAQGRNRMRPADGSAQAALPRSMFPASRRTCGPPRWRTASSSARSGRPGRTIRISTATAARGTGGAARLRAIAQSSRVASSLSSYDDSNFGLSLAASASAADPSSSAIAVPPSSPAPGRAITTIAVAAGITNVNLRLKHSRIRRFTRLRTTAVPIRRETVIPRRQRSALQDPPA
jgi:hypothetical protein